MYVISPNNWLFYILLQRIDKNAESTNFPIFVPSQSSRENTNAFKMILYEGEKRAEKVVGKINKVAEDDGEITKVKELEHLHFQ